MAPVSKLFRRRPRVGFARLEPAPCSQRGHRTRSLSSLAVDRLEQRIALAVTPQAPLSVNGTAGNTQVALFWSPPVADGGSSITDYRVDYSSDNGAKWITFNDGISVARQATVTGLTNGTGYVFRVSAVNAVGTGIASTKSSVLTPLPTALIAIAGSSKFRSIDWQFAAPAPFTYELANPGVLGAAVGQATINLGGTSTWTSATNGQSTVSGTMTGTVVGTNGTVTFSEQDTGDGLGSIADGKLSGNVVYTGTQTIVIPGVYSGTQPYSGKYSLVAKGAMITASYPHQLSITVSDDRVAGGTIEIAPSIVTTNDTGALDFAVTGSGGAQYLFRLNVTGKHPNVADPSAPVGRIRLGYSLDGTIAGVVALVPLTNEQSAIFWNTATKVVAADSAAIAARAPAGARYVVAYVDDLGTGVEASPANNLVRVAVPVAGAPTNLVGAAGNARVNLTWAAPVNTGGLAINDYKIEYTANSGATWNVFAHAPSSATTATVTGLTNGTAYMFRVSVVNSAGTGAASARSTLVTPRTVPGAPTNVVGVPGNSQVRLSWAAPATTGGAPIGDYVVQFKTAAAAAWSTFADGVSTSTAATVTGLTNGSAYVFRVLAVNAAGPGVGSATSATVTPRTVPGVPTNVVGTAGVAAAVLSWTAPASTGGVAITDYLINYSSDNGTSWKLFNDGLSNLTGATVTGLTKGTAYVFRVWAVNAAGPGAGSAASTAVTPL